MPSEKQLQYWESKKGKPTWSKGRKLPLLSNATKIRMSQAKFNYWKNLTQEQKKLRIEKSAVKRRGRPLSEKHCLSLCVPKKNTEKMSGENHYKWNLNREEVIGNKRDNTNAEYHLWARKVKNRDGWKCRIMNQDCDGILEAHHILNWVEYVELRYEINNGITLCHAHHPRSRVKEAELSPFFQKLVAEIE